MIHPAEGPGPSERVRRQLHLSGRRHQVRYVDHDGRPEPDRHRRGRCCGGLASSERSDQHDRPSRQRDGAAGERPQYNDRLLVELANFIHVRLDGLRHFRKRLRADQRRNLKQLCASGRRRRPHHPCGVAATNAGGKFSDFLANSRRRGHPGRHGARERRAPDDHRHKFSAERFRRATAPWSGSPASYAYQWQDCNSVRRKLRRRRRRNQQQLHARRGDGGPRDARGRHRHQRRRLHPGHLKPGGSGRGDRPQPGAEQRRRSPATQRQRHRRPDAERRRSRQLERGRCCVLLG